MTAKARYSTFNVLESYLQYEKGSGSQFCGARLVIGSWSQFQVAATKLAPGGNFGASSPQKGELTCPSNDIYDRHDADKYYRPSYSHDLLGWQ
jgi:hypothetical protein